MAKRNWIEEATELGVASITLEDLEILDGYDSTGELFIEVIDTYLASSPDLVALLRHPKSKDGTKSVLGAAHELKSSSANLGARNLSAICDQIEIEMSKNSSGAKLLELVEQACAEFIQVRNDLSKIKTIRKAE
ncbi:MAG: Hpt domain-containing protein [Bdellovibrionota bacterium]